MKISIESYGEKFTIETQNDDVDMNKMLQLLRQLLCGAGFAEKTVHDYLGEG